MLEVKINYDERETMEKSYRTIYSLHFESQIKKESFSLLSQLNFGDFVMEMQWSEGLAVVLVAKTESVNQSESKR